MASIPTNPRTKCYFECKEGGPLHHFPKLNNDKERFDVWKAVLDVEIQAKEDMYIFNQIRLCNKHFESYYISASKRLVRNAVPTLYIKKGEGNCILHLFPNPDKDFNRFQSWINAIGGEILMLDYHIVFDCRRVCHFHFEPQHYTHSRRLSRAAVPTLHLQDKVTTPLQEAKKQLSLEVILKDKMWDINNINSKKNEKLIGEMIALQNLPFDFVEGLGFRRLIQELAPRYSFRGRNFFTDFVCKELYGKVAQKVEELIEKFDYMSFTSDIWSDPSSNAFLLSLTCHGIAENFDKSSLINQLTKNGSSEAKGITFLPY